MPGIRHTLDALRAAALWLLVVCVVVGPAGLGGSTGLAAASKACGVSCPCEDAVVHEDHDDGHAELAEAAPCDHDDAAEQGGHAPCQDDCPDDCPNCGCCVGIAMAVLPRLLPVTTSAPTRAAARGLVSEESPVNRLGAGVFRPPRSLS